MINKVLRATFLSCLSCGHYVVLQNLVLLLLDPHCLSGTHQVTMKGDYSKLSFRIVVLEAFN